MGRRLRAESGRERSLPLRELATGSTGRAREERGLLARAGQVRSRDLPPDRRGSGAPHRADDRRHRRDRGRAARFRRAARRQRQGEHPETGRGARLVSRHQQPEEAVRRQAGPPGAQLRREQGRHRQGCVEGHGLAVRRTGAAGDVGAEPGLKAYPYDPQRAKKLLAEAGYPNGFTTTMWVPESGSGMQSPVAMATVMQSNLKAVGVTVSLQTMEWGAYLAKLRSKEQDLFA